MPRAFSEQEKNQIRTRLLEAGGKQFAAYGLRKTTVDELAAAVGISKGAFYLFYPSKEALFMDVAELAETQFRQRVLAAVAKPGPSPRARLYAVLHLAFSQWKTIPILQLFTQGEYDRLARAIPEAQLQEHLGSDRQFIEQLVTACQAAGIPIQIAPAQLDELLHALFFVSLHEDDFGPGGLRGAIALLLELVAAYCLGEVELSTPAVLDLVTPRGQEGSTR